MRLRIITFTLVTSLVLPTVCSAGPIQFDLATGNVKTTSFAPELAMALQGLAPPGPIYTFDPASKTPVTLTAVNSVPQMLPNPAPMDIHPDSQGGGYTHWNNDGYFSVDVSLMDSASGDSATVTFYGRAHMYNDYATIKGWTGITYFWFQNEKEVTLGGNDYTIWSDNLFEPGPATLHVWVGPDAPVSAAPEPGTFALAALGLIPFGLRRVRRMW
jgi:hypothetical protein